MKKFMLLYSGEVEAMSQKEREASMKVWEKWFQGLGKSIVDIGAPFARSKTLSNSGAKDGTGGLMLNGYTIFQANDMEAALVLAKGCPGILEGGKVHIFELASM